MIRYIHIGEQITEGDCAFALFDTVTNSFLSFAGDVVFLDYDDLREAWGATPEPKPEWSRIESLIEAYTTEQMRARKAGDSLKLAYDPGLVRPLGSEGYQGPALGVAFYQPARPPPRRTIARSDVRSMFDLGYRLVETAHGPEWEWP